MCQRLEIMTIDGPRTCTFSKVRWKLVPTVRSVSVHSFVGKDC